MGDTNMAESLVRVLVIEDNQDDRELLLHQLRKSGLDSQVKFVTDGGDALDFLTQLSSSSFSGSLIAIFLDLKLPGIDGLELLRRLRSQEVFQNLPVIVMTSSNDPKDIEECRRLKVANYVAKPVTYSSFSKAVADVFHRRRSETGPVSVEEV
jgi:two-component system, response regulator